MPYCYMTIYTMHILMCRHAELCIPNLQLNILHMLKYKTGHDKSKH